jgi:hypothetical protein
MGDARELYRTDFHAWAGEQAAALRALALERPNLPIDLEHLIEEVEGLGSEERFRVESLARLVMQHLLLVEHSPAVDQRAHRLDEIDEFRAQIRRRLSRSLRHHLESELDDIYAEARRTTARKMGRHGEPADALPAERPYGLEQVVGDWVPAGVEE